MKYYAFLVPLLFGYAQAQETDSSLAGWSFGGAPGTDYTVEITESPYGAKYAFIYSLSGTRTTWGGLGQAISAANYLGRSIEVAATIKTEDLKGWSGLWARIDAADGRVISLDNMSDRPLFGTTDWQRKRIVLAVPEDAARIVFGAIQNGAGHTWVDEFDIAVAPPAAQPTMGPSQNSYYNEPAYEVLPKTAINLDFEL